MLCAFAGSFGAAARADDSHAPLPGASGRAHGWVAIPPMGDRAGMTLLGHVPVDAPAGTLRFGPRLRAAPEALGAWENRLYIVYPPDEQRRARRVESIRVDTVPTPSGYDYSPRGRDPEAMPSLPGEGTLGAIHGTSAGMLVAILASDGAPARLLLLVGRTWRDVEPPEALGRARAAAVAEIGDRVGLLTRGQDGAWTAWWTSKDALAPSEADGAVEPAWAAESLDAGIRAEQIVNAGAQLVAASAGDGGVIRLRLLRAGSAYDLADVAHEGKRIAVLAVGERIAVVWQGPAPDPRLHMVVVSSNSGQTLHAGRALTVPIVSGRDLQTLALLLGAVVLTALVFVLRPEPADRQAVALPDGMALAGPMARFIAVTIDLGAPITIVATALRVEPTDLFKALILSESAGLRAATSILIGVFLTFVHSSVCETLTGRTIGKAMTGCSTHSIRGGRPTLMQSIVRNGLKLLCPPLGLFILIDPRRRHPADILARTVVLTRAPEPPTPG